MTNREHPADLIRRMSSIASCVSVGFMPAAGSSNITIAGYAATEHEDMNIEFNWIGPAYFSTMGIPLIAGRGIVRSDGPDAPKVAVINESFARHFFGRRNPLGVLFCFGAGNVKPDIQIVGVVKDAKYSRLREKPSRPAAQSRNGPSPSCCCCLAQQPLFRRL